MKRFNGFTNSHARIEKMKQVSYKKGLIDAMGYDDLTEDEVNEIAQDGAKIVDVSIAVGWGEYDHLLEIDIDGVRGHYLAKLRFNKGGKYE